MLTDRFTFAANLHNSHCSYHLHHTSVLFKLNISRYEVDTGNKGAGNWEISLAIKGTNGVVTEQDGGVFVCSFVYSESEEYHRNTDVYFYGQ